MPVLLVGWTLLQQYEQQRTSETLRDARTKALDIADLAVGPALPPGDLTGVSPEVAQRAVEQVVSRPAVRDQVLRIKVWDRRGRVVASDSPELLGVTFPVESEVARALGGGSHSEITRLARAENVEERGLGRAIEAYVPLHGPDPDVVVGVLEVYMPYEPLASELRRGERTLVVHLAVGLTAVVLSLGVLTTLITARLRRRSARVQHLADHDGLTGLLSRSAFEQRLGELVSAGRPAAVVLGDLDDFKRVNDALGHAAGDALLQHAGRVLLAAAPSGAVARLGGDEFAMLLPGVEASLDTENALTQLHGALSQEVVISGVPVSAVASLGAVLFPSQARSVLGLLQCADTAMYAAKARTSGTALYDGSHEPFDATQLQLLADLRRAVSADQLVLHYQAQVDAYDGHVVGVEALIRWQHPEQGLLAPDAFVPLAERTGLILPITRWVIDSAAAQLSEWLRAGLDVACSVNISARDLADPGLLDAALGAAHLHQVPAHRLCLELTETAILDDPVRAREALGALSEAGFVLSLDDFGQGYTSLSQLRDLPLAEVKLDRSFVTGMAVHPADRAIADTVAHLAHSLDLRVVAEGVETAAQSAALTALRYDTLQGWHHGRPGPADLVEHRLRADARRLPVEPSVALAPRTGF
ncbi:MAG: putative diguanylate cyclase/phosphodiesterase [Frankiales bacterium]|nr:putative diguanylate cyclase/phosphodiesterase [Frankiales bacterium]